MFCFVFNEIIVPSETDAVYHSSGTHFYLPAPLERGIAWDNHCNAETSGQGAIARSKEPEEPWDQGRNEIPASQKAKTGGPAQWLPNGAKI